MQRRQFLIQLAAFTTTSFLFTRKPLAALARSFEQNYFLSSETSSAAPFREVRGNFSSTDFNGDEIHRPHDILWDLEKYIQSRGGRPSEVQKQKVVIVGAGMSGMLAAYQLKEHTPLVIEQATQVGGNSKGEIYEDNAFSIGAAYVTIPEAGGDIARLFNELELKPRLEPASEARTHFKSKGLIDFWQGVSAPEAKESFYQVSAEIESIAKNEFPEIPWSMDPTQAAPAKLIALDNTSAEAWLKQKFPSLHPHVKEFFQVYCWSSFGGSLDEISAAQFLNFIAGETEGVLAFPGGNAAIIQAIYQKLQGRTQFESSAMVLEVKNVSGGVEVLYENSAGKLVRVLASGVIVAAPKYVSRYIVKDVPSNIQNLWKGLTYRAYVVVNILLDRKVTSPGFDIFFLEGKTPETPSFGRRTDRDGTDVCFADWSTHDGGTKSILTVYRPYPFEGARNSISSSMAHDRVKNAVLKTISPLLKDLGLSDSNIEGVRVTRWGHSLPLAQVGMLSQATDICRPVGERIYFANQDNYMNPAFETCFSSAQQAAEGLKRFL